MRPAHLRVGQLLWCVMGRGREFEVTMTKVGRKWAEIASPALYRRTLRIDINTLAIDGGEYVSPGRCYVDRAAYEHDQARVKAWGELQKAVRPFCVPDGLTLQTIQAALALLALEGVKP